MFCCLFRHYECMSDPLSTVENGVPKESSELERGVGQMPAVEWQARMSFFITVAAIAPVAGALVGREREVVFFLVDLLAWTVFVVDLAGNIRISGKYSATWSGRFDIGIVILTFPWYVFPPFEVTGLFLFFRWFRLARILFTGRGWLSLWQAVIRHNLVRTLGVVVVISAVCSVIVYYKESPETGFVSFGDSLWWSVVTMTTVGYGDLVPETLLGRLSAIALMLSGLVLLGNLAGILASFFRSDEGSAHVSLSRDAAVEIAGLRSEMAELNRRLADLLEREERREKRREEESKGEIEVQDHAGKREA